MSNLFVPGAQAELPWPKEIDHLSASSIGMLLRCPEQYRQVYILGKRRRPSAATIWGKADHAAVAFNYSQKLDSGEDVPVKTVMEKFVEHVDREVEAGGDEIDWREENPTAMRDKIMRGGSDLVAVYQSQVAPVTMPETVEDRFEYVDPLLPVPLWGYTDLIAQDFNQMTGEPTGNRRGIERKTTNKRLRKLDPEWALQGRVYQLQHGLPLEWQLSLKKANPEVQIDPEAFTLKPPPVVQTKMLVHGLMNELASYYRIHGPDEAWPGHGLAHTWACNYCGFRPDCYWWKETP